MRRRVITRWPTTLPFWLQWDCWKELTAPKPKPKKSPRMKAEWRNITDIERQAVQSYRGCTTPPYSFARRLQHQLSETKITDRQAHWLWFYCRKFRRQISDTAVVKEAEKQMEDTP